MVSGLELTCFVHASQPEGLESSQISDFFDMDFTTLPHKLLQPDEFQRQVLELRTRFVKPQNPDFVFKPSYHKRIPADGFAPYLASVWEQVVDNKDLDLPTQQELLAQFRCDEILQAAFTAFEAEVASYRRPIEAGQIMDGLGKGMNAGRQTALAAFDTAASRYHQGVYQRKRDELMGKMNSSLSPLFVGQLKNLHREILRDFRSGLASSLKGDNYDFGQLVTSAQQASEERFISAAKQIKLSDTDWSYEDGLSQLKDELKAIADTLRSEETKKMVIQIERAIKKQFAPGVEVALNKPSKDMWDKVLKAFTEALTKAESLYLRKAKGQSRSGHEDTGVGC